MARALLLWCCAGAVAAAAYSEYGAHPPLYDEPAPERSRPAPDDYRAHSPDAPAPLDYKYEEDIKGKTEQPSKAEMTEAEGRLRPARKHKKKQEDIDFGSDGVDQFDVNEDFPNMKSNLNHFTKHRSRFKSRKFDRNNEYSPRFSKKNKHAMDDDDVKIDDYSPSDEGGDLIDDKSNRLEGKSHRFDDKTYRLQDKSHRLDDKSRSHRTTNERVIRRNPRDGYVKRKSEIEEDEIEKMEESAERALQNRILERQEAQEQRRRPGRPPPPPPPSDDDTFAPPRPAVPNTNYEDEQEYYDMLRVMKVKNQLSTLPRRTKAPHLVPMAPLPFEELPETRRAGSRPPPAPPPLVPPPPGPGEDDLLLNRADTIDSTIRIANATTARAVTTTARPAPQASTMTTKSAKELSLAEKSRLSILKKIQRKESVPGLQLTAKPAVLLQVTSKMPTVVMVEPPSSEGPWQRARAVTADSPRRLRRVKQLMRHKLLSNARSINDLTENWDDLVCDYVDMSLLDASHASLTRRLSLSLSLIISLTFIISSGSCNDQLNWEI